MPQHEAASAPLAEGMVLRPGCRLPVVLRPTLGSGDTPDRLTLASNLARTGYPERAYAMALEVHEAAMLGGDDFLAAKSADCLTYTGLMISRYEQGVRFGRAAAAIWQQRGDRVRLSTTRATMAIVLATVGDADALIEADAALGLAETAPDDAEGELVWALQAKCLALVLLKHPERALPFGERAVELGRRTGPAAWSYVSLSEAIVWSRLAEEANPEDAALRRCVMQALALTREGLAHARDVEDRWLERLLVTNIAEYSLYVGDTRTAQDALAQAEKVPGEPTVFCRAHHMRQQARVLIARNRPEEALVALQAARDMLPADSLELLTVICDDIVTSHEMLGDFRAALAAHRVYHDLVVRRASEAAARRARLSSLQQEADELRAAASEARDKVANLAAHNRLLATEAERLLRTSLEDPLTGLPNRRQLNVAFLDAMSSGEEFALAMLDVDHFKQVNDRFSHPVGDAVLRSLATLLTGCTRANDLVVRLGGEEFALLLRQTDPATAAEICERLRDGVEARDWGALRSGLAVTVSIGLASVAEAPDAEALLELADLRLYAAKQGGRNRLVASGCTPSSLSA